MRTLALVVVSQDAAATRKLQRKTTRVQEQDQQRDEERKASGSAEELRRRGFERCGSGARGSLADKTEPGRPFMHDQVGVVGTRRVVV